jgi:hypothetical protein
MALTLAITDNASPTTGIVATITGSDPGSTNTLYTQAANYPFWAQQGSRTGDGTIAAALPSGHFNAYVFSTAVGGLPAVSPVTNQFAVTAGNQSVEERLLLAVQASIQQMVPAGSLPGLKASNVFVRAVPGEDVRQALPCVLLTPIDRDPCVGTTTGKDDFGKPVVVILADRKDPGLLAASGQPAVLSPFLLWRERIVRRFISQRLPAVAEAISCTFEPDAIFNPRAAEFEFLVSSFTLRFRTREPRGA